MNKAGKPLCIDYKNCKNNSIWEVCFDWVSKGIKLYITHFQKRNSAAFFFTVYYLFSQLDG